MNVSIYRSAAPVTAERIAALEQRLGLQLPKDYRVFLLEHNGGMPRHNTFHFRDKDDRPREAWLGWIYSVGTEGKLDPEDLDLETAYAQRPAGLPAGLLPIAFTWFPGNYADRVASGMVCVAAGQGADRSKVFLRPNIDPARDTVYPVAITFGAFLKSLTGDERPQPWKELIQDGNAAGLSEWLAENKKKWKSGAVSQGEMLHEAVSEAHWDVIEVLLKNGFSAEDMFEKAVGGRRPRIARRLLERGGLPISAIQGTLVQTWSEHFWKDLDLVRALIDAGADVNHINSLGSTPLHYAGLAGVMDAVRLLLEQNANPTIVNDDKEIPAEAARRKEHEEVARVLDETAASWRARSSTQQRNVAEPDLHGVTFRKSGPPLTPERLAELEDALGLDFPPEYRGLLLRHNGGVPKPAKFRMGVLKANDDDDDSAGDEEYVDPSENQELGERVRAMNQQYQELLMAGRFDAAEELTGQMNELLYEVQPQSTGEDDTAVIDWFYPLGPGVGKAWPRVSFEEIHENLKEGSTPKRLLPIASVEGLMEGGTLHISCQGKDRGHIYFRPGELESHEETVYPVAESLSALFERLAARAKRKKSPRDTAEQAIRDGDTDALQQALASGVKPHKRNRQGQTLLDLAIAEGQDECVVMLIAHGAPLDEAFQTALHFGAARLIRRLLDLGQGSPAIVKQALLVWGIYTDPGLVRELIARGADPNVRGQDGT
ncbi:MAG TPA: SMI1/KNR4 family protein, partial [Gemmataceae bacterium]|nr:SMI1/KNR4 family protein [Gemmataceae bacterium]